MKESFKETTSNWKKEGRSTSTPRTFLNFLLFYLLVTQIPQGQPWVALLIIVCWCSLDLRISGRLLQGFWSKLGQVLSIEWSGNLQNPRQSLRDHVFMMSIRMGGGGSWNLSCVWRFCCLKKKRSIYFCWWRCQKLGSQNWLFFCGRHKCMSP